MAYTNSLLNCRRSNPTGGSNPPLSAERDFTFLFVKSFFNFLLNLLLSLTSKKYHFSKSMFELFFFVFKHLF